MMGLGGTGRKAKGSNTLFALCPGVDWESCAHATTSRDRKGIKVTRRDIWGGSMRETQSVLCFETLRMTIKEGML